MTIAQWLIVAPLCTLAAFAIAFGVLGIYALWDVWKINHRDDE